MKLLSALRTTVARVAVRAAQWTLAGLTADMAAKIFGIPRQTLSGVLVTDRSALESSEYFASVRNPSEDLATLPLITYRRISDTRRERDPDHWLYPILHDQPNDEQDAVQFIEMLQAWLMMRRNAYAEIQRTNGGRPVALWPIPSNRVSPERVKGELLYRIDLDEPNPETGLRYVYLDRSRVFHLKAFTLDGVVGESSIDLHQEAIGLALALDRYGAAFFGNDATPGGVYEVPGTLTDAAYKRMKADLEQPHKGLDQKHRIALLEEGTKFHETSVPNDKAQFIDSKRYSTEQMARLNRVPPHKIGDLSRSTNNNIEHQGIDYVISSIRPWAVRWEKAIATQLLTRDERRTHYAEFLLDALLRGDAKSRAETLAIKRQNGVINADEWRALDNENEIEDGSGKVYLVNGNMIPIAQAGQPRDFALDDEGRIRSVRVRSERHGEPMDATHVFAPLFRAAAERCLAKESAAVGKAIDRELRAGGVKALEAWMDKFYREHEATVKQAFVPLAVSVGEALRGETGPDLGDWAISYARTVAVSRREAAVAAILDIARSGAADVGAALRPVVDAWAKPEAAERMAKAEASEMVVSLKRCLARERAA
jgi:HK97 family phage portal protein